MRPATQTTSFLLQFDLVICLVIFVVVTAFGSLSEGYGIDDWMQMHGPDDEWVYFYGRWATHAASLYFFNGHYFHSFQLTASFACLFQSSRILAGYASVRERSIVTVIIFVMTVNHIYMVEVMIFSSHIATYSAAIFLSIWSFHLLAELCHDHWWWNPVRIAVSALLLALCLGIYQTFALAGIVIFGLLLVRSDRYSLDQILKFALISAAASILALVFHFALLFFYQTAMDIWEPTNSNAVQSYFFRGSLFSQAALLPRIILDLHSLNANAFSPEGMKIIHRMAVFGVSMIFGGAIWCSFVGKSERDWESLVIAVRLAVAAIVVFCVLPVIFVPVVTTYISGRAFGYIGAWYAAMALAVCAAHLQGATPTKVFWQRFTYGLLISMATWYVWLALAAWEDRSRIDEQNRAITQSVMTRVASLPGYDGGPFGIYGGIQYDDTPWAGPIGLSVFCGRDSACNLIFKELFNLGWHPYVLLQSPRPCPAFPAYDSVFVYEGTVVVCLERFD